MLKYIFKNLKSQFTKQGVISLLLVVNIVVSALVICFSYGLYQNYNMFMEGYNDEAPKILCIKANPGYITYDEYKTPFSGVTFGMALEFSRNLSNDTCEKIDNIFFMSPFESKEMFDIGYGAFEFTYKPINGSIVNTQFPMDSYDRGDKIVLVPWGALIRGENDNSIDSNYEFVPTFQGFNECKPSTIPISSDSTSIEINGEEYTIIHGIDLGKEKNTSMSIISPASVPQDAFIRYSETRFITIVYKNNVDSESYMEIIDAVSATMGDVAYVENIEIQEEQEIYYYKTIILISVVIAILAAINMAILYRYILEKRSSELAIFRICGCSKAKAVMSYLIECMLINAPLFALTQLCYHKLIMPKLSDLFPHMQGAYSFKLYAAIFGIYVVASLVVMLIMIVATIRKHSLVEQKNSSKAKTRFGIMKLFEVLQLAIVLTLTICITSTTISRYSYYAPFEEFLKSQGYVVQADVGVSQTTSEISEMIPDADIIYTIADGAKLKLSNGNGEVLEFSGLAYDDEFIDAYSPELDKGIWLNETMISFEKDNVIPAVITSCNGRFDVGDVFENEVVLMYDEFNNPIEKITLRYEIVGVLKDNASVISKFNLPNKIENVSDLYGVYNDSFEEKDMLLVRARDQEICFKSQTDMYYPCPLGVQLILCNNMSHEDYKRIGIQLRTIPGFSVSELSEVNKNSLEYIYEQMYTLFPIALCIFILTVISAVSINAIYTKRQLRNYAIFYICGARWRTCALKSLKDSAITCAVASALCALILFIGKQSFLKETVISFGIWHAVICVAVIALYLLLSMIMPIAIIGSSQPKDVLKEE